MRKKLRLVVYAGLLKLLWTFSLLDYEIQMGDKLKEQNWKSERRNIMNADASKQAMRTHWMLSSSYTMAFTVTRSQPNWTPMGDFVVMWALSGTTLGHGSLKLELREKINPVSQQLRPYWAVPYLIIYIQSKHSVQIQEVVCPFM